MAKKISIVLIVISMSLIFFLGGYLVNQKISQRHSSSDFALINNSLVNRFQSPSDSGGPSTLPTPPVGLFTISDKAYLFIAPSATDGQVLAYDSATGGLQTIAIDHKGANAPIATIKPKADQVSWAGNGKRVLATYTDTATFYDLEATTSKDYAAAISKPAINKKGDHVAYIYLDAKTGDNSISVADTQLADYKVVLPTRSTNWTLEWLNDTTLGLISTNGYTSTSIYTLDTETRAFTNIIDSQYVFDHLWSPDGNQLIYATYQSGQATPQLNYIDVADHTTRTLSIGSLASHCAWSVDNKHIICVLQDSNTSKLSIVSLDTSGSDPNASQPKILYTDTITTSFKSLLLSTLEDYVVLIDQDNKLWGLHLN